MSFLAGIGDLLKQYSVSGVTPGNNPAVEQHFDQVAQPVPSSTLASGLSEAFRSGQTASFPQMAAQLFANGNSQQQAGVVQSGSVTPAQAASVSPADIEALTSHAQNQDPSLVYRVSAIYAQHPMLIKSLGAAAFTIALKKIADSRAT